MKELRCKKCKKLLAKVDDTSDRVYGRTQINIKCKCGYNNQIELH